MTMYGRNDRSALAALTAEEERRRANEEAGSGRHAAEDVGGMPDRARTPILLGAILALIVVGLWIALATGYVR